MVRGCQVALALLYALMPSEGSSYCQTSATDFQPLAATITVLDESGLPMGDMNVRAVNHEYGLPVSATTDSTGRALLRVMPGTWSIYASPSFSVVWARAGRGYLLVGLGEQFDDSDRTITLSPTTTALVTMTSPVFNFSARENYVGFIVEPYGQFLQHLAGPASYVGVAASGQTSLTLHTNAGLIVRGYVVSPRSSGEALFFVQQPRLLSSPYAFQVTSANSGVLRIDARDASGVPADYHLQLHSDDLSWAWSPYIADLPNTVTGVRLAPSQYHAIRAVDMLDASSARFRVELDPIIMTIDGGEVRTMTVGGELGSPTIRTTPRSASGFGPATQIMMYMNDAYRNVVRKCTKLGTGDLNPNIVVRYDGLTSPPFTVLESFTSRIGMQFDRSTSPTYDVTWNFGPWGSGTSVGNLYGQNERRMAIDETGSLLSQAPRLDRAARLNLVSEYEAFAEAMEGIFGVPTDYKMGVISNIAIAGFEDEVQHGYKLETGIELNVPLGRTRSDGYVDHEAGHGRIHKPPSRFFAVRAFYEAYATLVGAKARSEIHGGGEYLKFLLGAHDFFLRHLHGAPITGTADEIEAIQFVTHYINARYGWASHRRMILEWENAFRGIRVRLGAAGYGDVESFAIVYSWVVDENLGAVFAAAGFPVTEARVASGLSVVQSYLDGLQGPRLGVGVNRVEAPLTSIPVELVPADADGVTDIRFTLTYDSMRATVVGVYRRDLTDQAGWDLIADTSTPGRVVIHLSGSSVLKGAGSVAQVNLRLMLGATGSMNISLVDANVDGTPAPVTDGALVLPGTPLIGSFPDLAGGVQNEQYSVALWAVAGNAPYSWSVVEDVLPAGLTLDSVSGEVRGVPTTPGEYLFRVRVTDGLARMSHRWFTIRVCPASCDDGSGCTVDGCDLEMRCINFPAPAGVPCEDGDACTQGDSCDGAGRCQPGTIRQLPGEVPNLVIDHDYSTGASTVGWHPAVSPISPPLYDTILAEAPDDFLAGGVCVESDDGTDLISADATVPPVGTAYYFLVRAENVCGSGPLGTSSAGTERSARNCP